MQPSLSFIDSCKCDLQDIEQQMLKLLDISTIERFNQSPNSQILVIAPPYYWGKPNEEQTRIQIQLKKDYSLWIERLRFLFECSTEEINKKIDEIDKFVLEWIEKKSGWTNDIPSSIEEAKQTFHERVGGFYDLLDILNTSESSNVILVPDTNSLIAEPDFSKYESTIHQKNLTIVLVPTVLSELDRLKIIHREPDFREKVNSVIRRIKGLRNQGNLQRGVIFNKTIFIKMRATEPQFSKTLSWLDATNNDDRVIASVLEIQRENPSSITLLITADINLQNKAEMAKLPFRELP